MLGANPYRSWFDPDLWSPLPAKVGEPVFLAEVVDDAAAKRIDRDGARENADGLGTADCMCFSAERCIEST